MIKVFNSAYRESIEQPKMIPLDEVNIVSQKIDYFNGAPYILFEHKDYPGGALRAAFDGTYWSCDLC
jgi:hypothetical protein